MTDSIHRIWLMIGDSLSSALHNRWFSLSAGAVLLFVFFSRTLSSLPWGSSGPKMFFDLGQTVIQVFAGAFLILMLAHQFYCFVDRRTSHMWFVRRLSRMEFILGKGLGVWIAVGSAVVVADIFHWLLLHQQIAAVGQLSGDRTPLPGAGGWFQLIFLKLVMLLVITGLSLFFASLSRSFLFTAMASLLFWMGSLVVAEAYTLADSMEGAGGVLLDIIRLFLPQFATWNLSSQIWLEGVVSTGILLRASLSGLCYAALFAGLGALVFRRRDL